MQVHDRYPLTAAGGCCMITRKHEVPEGERVINLDLELEGMPAFGLLCISEEGVRLLNTALGWNLDGARDVHLQELYELLAVYEAENDRLRQAVLSALRTFEAVDATPPAELDAAAAEMMVGA